jgi:pimeloyl-ACP methyl ester carboxylesterase
MIAGSPWVASCTVTVDAEDRSRHAPHRRRIRYDGPVSAIWGEHDRLVPVSHGEGVQAALPRARADIWSAMGHHPIRERLDDLIATIEHATSAGEQRTRPDERPALTRAA